jgi:formate dehydrogenase major subunit
MANSDCIVIQGSNMAECHPVAYQWVTEAKMRGATVIHVDPRFTRTSATATKHVPIRVGSDIVFLGALIRHVLENELYFREYVVAYTNAATLISEDFRDTEDLDGIFSGYDAKTGAYDLRSWAYAEADGGDGPADDADPGDGGATEGDGGVDGGVGEAGPEEHGADKADRAAGDEHGSGGPALEHAEVLRDETLQDPRTVFQILRRHYARYTPELVEQLCGISQEDFRYVADAITANSGRDRTTCFAYAVGWTQHSLGAQYIRTAAILQLLLGNMGRPGGGIMALRGHASIQGSTDIPTLFNLLPGYLPMPVAGTHDTLGDYLDAVFSPQQKGFWTGAPAYFTSLMKSYWGDAATKENDWAFDYLPRLTGSHNTYATAMAMLDDEAVIVNGGETTGQDFCVCVSLGSVVVMWRGAG